MRAMEVMNTGSHRPGGQRGPGLLRVTLQALVAGMWVFPLRRPGVQEGLERAGQDLSSG
jgi:hypothetical protein